jgi:hypothetical protein
VGTAIGDGRDCVVLIGVFSGGNVCRVFDVQNAGSLGKEKFPDFGADFERRREKGWNFV